MKEKNSSHCFVRTDLELLVQLFRQVEDKGITDFRELENFLGKNQLANFDDLVQFITGPDCPDDIAIAAEEVLDRLRLASPKRKAVLTSSVEVGNYLADKLVGHKQEELWALYIDNASHIIAEKNYFKVH